MTPHSNAIILCGGLATRLPNKLLLPSRRKGWAATMLYNVFQHVMDCGFHSVTFALKNDTMGRAIQAQLLMLRETVITEFPLISFTWDDGNGLPFAINRAMMKNCQNAVFCGDNVYEDAMTDYPNVLHFPIAVCRDVPLDAAKHLDFFGESSVLYPRENARDRVHSLTTPWIFPQGMRLCEEPDFGIVRCLNKLFIQPHVLPLNNWTDLGTEETYLNHWSSK